MGFRILALIITIIIAWNCILLIQSAQAQQPRTSNCPGYAQGRDVPAQIVFTCLSNLRLPNGGVWSTTYHRFSCDDYKNDYLDALRISNRSSKEPTCAVISEAVRQLTDKPAAWGRCVDDGRLGSAEHISACLTQYLPRWNSTNFRSLDNCQAILRFYTQALSHAGAQYGATTCAEAVKAAELAAGGRKPQWAACMNYSPEKRMEHLRACLSSASGRIGSCAEGRALYETRLREAYGGSALPKTYIAATCDDIAPILSQISAAQQSPAPVRLPIPQGKSTGPSVELIFFIIGGGGLLFAAWWSIFRKKKGGLPFGRTAELTLTEDQIRSMFEAKQGDVTYEGKFEEDLLVQAGNESKFHRLSLDFKLVRNIAAMPHREREFLRIFLLLNIRGWLGGATSDRIHFGLVFGDGAAASYAKEFHVTVGAARTYGIHSVTDALHRYGKGLGATINSAISELLSALDALRKQFPDDPLVNEIQRQLVTGNRWFEEEDTAGSPFDSQLSQYGLFLGLLPTNRKPISYYGEGSLATIAPPGAGKTQAHIIPNLLLWRGAAVVLDIKGELWAKTSKWRERVVGPVYRFAPFEPQRSHCYNPLSAIRSHPDFLWEDSAALAELLVIPRSTTDPFWEESAQRFLTAFIAFVCRWAKPSDRPMSRVLDIASGVAFDAFLDAARTDTDFPSLARAAASFGELDGRLRSNILNQVLTSLKAWEGARISRVTQRSDWSPLDLRGDKNMTIYICIKPEEIESALSLLRVFIGQHIRILTRELPPLDKPDVLFLLDEFPQLRRMPPVEEGISVGRGYKMKLWLISQSLGQIRNAYQNADGLLGQCGLRCFMNPNLQDGTAQKVSADIGEFDSIIDGKRQPVIEPQAAAGPEYKNLMLVSAQGSKPLRLEKVMAHESENMTRLFGEAEWPPKNERAR